MKEPHDNLLYILNEITDFAFKGLSTKGKLLIKVQEGFFHNQKLKLKYLPFTNKQSLVWSSMIFLKVMSVPWRQLLK